MREITSPIRIDGKEEERIMEDLHRANRAERDRKRREQMKKKLRDEQRRRERG